MKLNLNLSYVITFLALTFVMHEAHEIIHTSIGRLICGCWGLRDFNVWELCAGCLEQKPYAVISTFLGPLFTFIMIWLGALLLSENKTEKQKMLGFSLIFANMPFARIFTAIMGGGDEIWGLHELTGNYQLSRWIGLMLVLAITFIPLVKAYQIIQNRLKIGLFILFLLAPFVIDLLVVLGLLNTLLQNGIMNEYGIMGSPVLVTVWTLFVTLVYLLTKKNLYKLCHKEHEDVSRANNSLQSKSH